MGVAAAEMEFVMNYSICGTCLTVSEYEIELAFTIFTISCFELLFDIKEHATCCVRMTPSRLLSVDTT